MTGAFKTWLAGGLALSTGVSCILALLALRAGGEVRLGPQPILSLAAGYDRKAEPLLAPTVPPPPVVRREAAELSRLAISQYPYDTGAWLRLAYVDALDNGRLTAAGEASLRRSYDLIAVDPQLGPWRIRFALAFGQALPKDLRDAVRNEVNALGRDGAARANLRQMVVAIPDPVGAVWLQLWLTQLESTVSH